MSTASILFPLGVRLSTWLTLGVFLTLGLRDRRYWLAAAAWMVGFEVAWQATLTSRIIDRGGFHPHAWWQPVFVFGAYALGVTFVVFAALRGVKPSLPLMAVVAGLWAFWVATGFVSNSHTMIHFDAGAEAVNESIKTLWAVAYLVVLAQTWAAWKSWLFTGVPSMPPPPPPSIGGTVTPGGPGEVPPPLGGKPTTGVGG